MFRDLNQERFSKDVKAFNAGESVALFKKRPHEYQNEDGVNIKFPSRGKVVQYRNKSGALEIPLSVVVSGKAPARFVFCLAKSLRYENSDRSLEKRELLIIKQHLIEVTTLCFGVEPRVLLEGSLSFALHMRREERRQRQHDESLRAYSRERGSTGEFSLSDFSTASSGEVEIYLNALTEYIEYRSKGRTLRLSTFDTKVKDILTLIHVYLIYPLCWEEPHQHEQIPEGDSAKIKRHIASALSLMGCLVTYEEYDSKNSLYVVPKGAVLQ